VEWGAVTTVDRHYLAWADYLMQNGQESEDYSLPTSRSTKEPGGNGRACGQVEGDDAGIPAPPAVLKPGVLYGTHSPRKAGRPMRAPERGSEMVD
jgi:hypothetical protein